ncbi:unnamed protein product [Allacma fusca]|uniref:Uncharacterized protein n=1 Tax=Allacma fusca TaxID=39272 RepID=A0A8J2L7Z7_9HEXA|nr:unnamed protein product [Allacma fusca]
MCACNLVWKLLVVQLVFFTGYATSELPTALSQAITDVICSQFDEFQSTSNIPQPITKKQAGLKKFAKYTWTSCSTGGCVPFKFTGGGKSNQQTGNPREGNSLGQGRQAGQKRSLQYLQDSLKNEPAVDELLDTGMMICKGFFSPNPGKSGDDSSGRTAGFANKAAQDRFVKGFIAGLTVLKEAANNSIIDSNRKTRDVAEDVFSGIKGLIKKGTSDTMKVIDSGVQWLRDLFGKNGNAEDFLESAEEASNGLFAEGRDVFRLMSGSMELMKDLFKAGKDDISKAIGRSAGERGVNGVAKLQDFVRVVLNKSRGGHGPGSFDMENLLVSGFRLFDGMFSPNNTKKSKRFVRQAGSSGGGQNGINFDTIFAQINTGLSMLEGVVKTVASESPKKRSRFLGLGLGKIIGGCGGCDGKWSGGGIAGGISIGIPFLGGISTGGHVGTGGIGGNIGITIPGIGSAGIGFEKNHCWSIPKWPPCTDGNIPPLPTVPPIPTIPPIVPPIPTIPQITPPPPGPPPPSSSDEGGNIGDFPAGRRAAGKAIKKGRASQSVPSEMTPEEKFFSVTQESVDVINSIYKSGLIALEEQIFGLPILREAYHPKGISLLAELLQNQTSVGSLLKNGLQLFQGFFKNNNATEQAGRSTQEKKNFLGGFRGFSSKELMQNFFKTVIAGLDVMQEAANLDPENDQSTDDAAGLAEIFVDEPFIIQAAIDNGVDMLKDCCVIGTDSKPYGGSGSAAASTALFTLEEDVFKVMKESIGVMKGLNDAGDKGSDTKGRAVNVNPLGRALGRSIQNDNFTNVLTAGLQLLKGIFEPRDKTDTTRFLVNWRATKNNGEEGEESKGGEVNVSKIFNNIHKGFNMLQDAVGPTGKDSEKQKTRFLGRANTFEGQRFGNSKIPSELFTAGSQLFQGLKGASGENLARNINVPVTGKAGAVQGRAAQKAAGSGDIFFDTSMDSIEFMLSLYLVGKEALEEDTKS